MTGRSVPDYPALTLSSGHTVRCRRVSPDTPARLQAAAMRELAESRPAVPTENVVMGVDPRTQTEVRQDVPRPDDAAYLQAFATWEAQVRRRAAEKWRQLLEDYAVTTETDGEAVAAFRVAMVALGDALPDESDRQVWLWRIVAPTSEDQTALMAFVLGRSIPGQEAIQAQKDTFRRDVPAA